MKRLRTAIIGMGKMGKIRYDAMKKHGGFDIVALCDTNRHNLENFTEPCFLDWKQCLEETELEAIIVCTYNAYIPDIVCEALEKGLHVFSEKPPGRNLADTLRIDVYKRQILGDMPSHERNQILKYCFSHNIRTYSVPKISDILMRSSSELTLFDTPMLLSRNDGLTIEQEFCKRTMDVVLSLIGAIITLPFFLVIAICIKATDGGPVFYKQTRLTKDGKEFEIIKFRTMIQDAEKQSGARLASEGDDRILPVGKLLRRLRLDELPQIYNILKGEM